MAEEGIESLTPGSWWVEGATHPLRRGQLVKAFVPHVDLVPYAVVPEGRAGDSTT